MTTQSCHSMWMWFVIRIKTIKMNLTTYDWLSWICIRVSYSTYIILTWGELIFRSLLPSIPKIKIIIEKKNTYIHIITIEYIFCPWNEIYRYGLWYGICWRKNWFLNCFPKREIINFVPLIWLRIHIKHWPMNDSRSNHNIYHGNETDICIYLQFTCKHKMNFINFMS